MLTKYLFRSFILRNIKIWLVKMFENFYCLKIGKVNELKHSKSQLFKQLDKYIIRN